VAHVTELSDVTHPTWAAFMGDPRHTGFCDLDLPGPVPRAAWRFRPGNHVWAYEHGAGPWSSSALILPELRLILVGSYDHNLYALDSGTGRERWRFTAGGRIDGAPVLVQVASRPLVILASADRSIHAVDVVSGEGVWSTEIRPWSFTVPPAHAGSPCAAQIDGRPVLFCTLWINDHRAFANVQRGEVVALEARDGAILWRRQLSSMRLSSPAVDRDVVFVVGHDGQIQALDARCGELIWRRRASNPSRSSPLVCTVERRVLVGDDYGLLTCLDTATGAVDWAYKAGHAIHATPCRVVVGGRTLAVFGSFDRRVHAVDVATGEAIWTFRTGDMIRSSPLALRQRGAPAVLVYSMDRHLYLLDAADGKRLGEFATGGYLWPIYTRSESLGSSPSAAVVDGEPLVILPGDDGVIHGLRFGGASALARR